MKTWLFPLLFFSVLLAACRENTSPGDDRSRPAILVKNEAGFPREELLVEVEAATLTEKYPELDTQHLKLTAGEDLPFQWNDRNGDGQPETLNFLVSLAPGEEKTVLLQPLAEGETPPVFQKRTQAELSHKVDGQWEDREYIGGQFQNVDYLRVPPEHTDHSWFIRYEGPGWESDRVGYRFYLDWRNAVDIFGKKTKEMVLQNVGQDGFDSYHEPAGWGMDILKVGKSLGLGSLGIWLDGRAQRVETTDSIVCAIPLNGPIRSMVTTRYYGWQAGETTTDLTSDLSIHAGSRLTRHDVALSGTLPNLCTGIGKLDKTELLASEDDSQWGYLATWGEQSLAGDDLGMAVFYRTADRVQVTEDEENHLIILQPEGGRNLTYYFLAAWSQEPEGIRSKEEFATYLKHIQAELGSPVQIRLR